MIKDKLLFSKTCRLFKFICCVCNKPGHYEDYCPDLHVVPKKTNVVRNYASMK